MNTNQEMNKEERWTNFAMHSKVAPPYYLIILGIGEACTAGRLLATLAKLGLRKQV